MPLLKQFTAAALAAIALSPVTLIAQEKSVAGDSAHYKLTYRLLEVAVDGKVVNSRTYITIVGEGKDIPFSKIRTGDRVPIPVHSGNNTDFQYQDIGTDIDTVHPQIQGRQLSLHVTAASSGIGKPVINGVPGVPVFREIRWESNVVVTLDKPTIIFSSDNVSDTGKTELELTATEVH